MSRSKSWQRSDRKIAQGSMSGSFKFTGGAELAAKLWGMTDKAAINVMRGATLVGAGVIRDRARSLAPILAEEELAKRDPTKLRAFLSRKKIASLISKGRSASRANLRALRGLLRRSIMSGRGRGTKDKVVAIIGLLPVAYYGRFVEFGTRKMGAHPFMRPAMDLERENAVNKMIEYSAGRIQDEANRA